MTDTTPAPEAPETPVTGPPAVPIVDRVFRYAMIALAALYGFAATTSIIGIWVSPVRLWLDFVLSAVWAIVNAIIVYVAAEELL